MADQDPVHGAFESNFDIPNYSKWYSIKWKPCMHSRPCPIVLFSKVTFAFMFLTISTCWNPWLIPDSGWKWWIAYRSRFSKKAHNWPRFQLLQRRNELPSFALLCQLHVRGSSHRCRLWMHTCWFSGLIASSQMREHVLYQQPSDVEDSAIPTTDSSTRCCGTTQ